MALYLVPFAIIVGAGMAAAAFLSYAFWRPLSANLRVFFDRFVGDLDVAGLSVKPEQLVTAAAVITVIAWVMLVVLVRPSLWLSVVTLPVLTAIVAIVMGMYIGVRKAKRIEEFQHQLELVLRGLTSGLRASLGLRQALVYVAEEVGEPAHTELARVIGASNLGVSILDALDQMAERIGTHEVRMLASVVRVQSKSGGDLGVVLERLAETIRARRQFDRKVRALTSQSRATAWVLGLLPVLLFTFIMVTQPAMRFAVLNSGFGWGVMAVGFGLDALAIAVLLRMLRIDV